MLLTIFTARASRHLIAPAVRRLALLYGSNFSSCWFTRSRRSPPCSWSRRTMGTSSRRIFLSLISDRRAGVPLCRDRFQRQSRTLIAAVGAFGSVPAGSVSHVRSHPFHSDPVRPAVGFKSWNCPTSITAAAKCSWPWQLPAQPDCVDPVEPHANRSEPIPPRAGRGYYHDIGKMKKPGYFTKTEIHHRRTREIIGKKPRTSNPASTRRS